MPHFVWSKINGTTARRRSGRTPPPLTKGFRLNRYTRRLHASQLPPPPASLAVPAAAAAHAAHCIILSLPSCCCSPPQPLPYVTPRRISANVPRHHHAHAPANASLLPPHAALLQRSRRASHCIPHNHHERKRFTRTRWDEEHQRCRDRAQQLAAPAPRIHRRAFGASRVFACFQNQRGVFRSCGASPCSADPSAALARGTHEHRCVAAACCGVQRSFERAACAEADLLSK